MTRNNFVEHHFSGKNFLKNLTHPPWGCVCLFSFWGFPHTFLRFFLINFHHIKASNLIFVCEFFSDQEQHNGGSFVGCSIKEYRKKTKKRISDFWWVSFSLFFFPQNSSKTAPTFFLILERIVVEKRPKENVVSLF